MKNINKELIKNIGIGILVVIAIILLLMVIFYNKISIGRVLPKAEEYQLSDEIKEEIENENSDENSEIITTYELDASDLKQYEKTKEYNKGKKDPFAAESSETSDTDKETNSGDTEKSENNETSSSNNFYEDDGTK